MPAGYDPNDTTVRYNVLYLLHGVGGDQYEWLSSNGKVDGRFIICNIFDNLIVNGDIDPLIVVFPNGRSAYDWTDSSFNSEGTNMLEFYYFDYELRYDLIPFIESNYAPTSSDGITLVSLTSCVHNLHLLYTTCGDSDGVANGSYAKSVEGLTDTAGDFVGDYYQVLLKNCVHDFNVWNNGA